MNAAYRSSLVHHISLNSGLDFVQLTKTESAACRGSLWVHPPRVVVGADVTFSLSEVVEMRTLRIFLSGLGTGAVLGRRLAPRARKGTERSAKQRMWDGVDQVSFVGRDAYAHQATDALKERYSQSENRSTSVIADLVTKLSSLQEWQKRWALSFNESQSSIAADLRRLRVLVIWTVIMSCFGVVSFAIVLFLAYVKF